MEFFDIFKIKKYKKTIRELRHKNNCLENEMQFLERDLNSYTTNKKLNRLFQVPRQIGTELYVITDLDMKFDIDTTMFVCRSDKKDNNVKIISITITHFVINSSGTYIGFNNNYGENSLYIPIDSPNLFLNADAAIHELLHNHDNISKYKNNPFVNIL